MTPGGTFGLEFTSLMAVLAVALFVAVAYTVIVGGEAGRRPATKPRSTWSKACAPNGWSRVKAVTALGGLLRRPATGGE